MPEIACNGTPGQGRKEHVIGHLVPKIKSVINKVESEQSDGNIFAAGECCVE